MRDNDVIPASGAKSPREKSRLADASLYRVGVSRDANNARALISLRKRDAVFVNWTTSNTSATKDDAKRRSITFIATRYCIPTRTRTKATTTATIRAGEERMLLKTQDNRVIHNSDCVPFRTVYSARAHLATTSVCRFSRLCEETDFALPPVIRAA